MRAWKLASVVLLVMCGLQACSEEGAALDSGGDIGREEAARDAEIEPDDISFDEGDTAVGEDDVEADVDDVGDTEPGVDVDASSPVDRVDVCEPIFEGWARFGRERWHEFAFTERYLYLSSTLGLEVYDTIDPGNAVRVGELVLPSAASLLSVGDALFVRVQPDALVFIDVSDPTQPTERGRWESSAGIVSAKVVGDRVVIASGGRVSVLDASDPSSPQMLGSAPVTRAGGFEGFAASQTRAYLMLDRDIHVFDISRDTPVVGAIYETGGSARGSVAIAEYGERVVVARSLAFDGNLMVLDAANPDDVRLVGELSYPGSAANLVVAGDKAFIGYQVALRSFDISGVPFPLGGVRFERPNGASMMREHRGVIMFDDLSRVDISQPQLPVEIAPVRLVPEPTDGEAIDVAFYGRHLLVADAHGGLRVFDLSEPVAPVEVGHLPAEGIVTRVTVNDGQGWMYENNRGWVALDLEDVTAPSEVGVVMARENAIFAGALLLDAAGGARMTDISNPSAPVTTIFETSFIAKEIAVIGTDLYVLSGRGDELWVVDISDPAEPIERAALTAETFGLSRMSSIDAVGEWLLIDNELFAFDDVDSPQSLGTFREDEWLRSWKFDGDIMYALSESDQGGAMLVVDWSVPSSPESLGRVPIVTSNPVRFDIDQRGVAVVASGARMIETLGVVCGD